MRTIDELTQYFRDEDERIRKLYGQDEAGWMARKYDNEARRFNYILLKLNDIYEALQESDPWEHDERIKWN